MSIKGIKVDGNTYRYDYNYLDNAPNVTPDKTLSISDRPADARTVGNRLTELTAAVGTPLKATTVAGMTDTSKIYVYTGSETGYTAGHWYYHDGTAWTDGGVYNSVAVNTDTTLSVSGAAADAKKTGDEITDIKGALRDEVFLLKGDCPTDLNTMPIPGYYGKVNAETHSPLPDDYTNSTGILVNMPKFFNNTYGIQILYGSNNSVNHWIRICRCDGVSEPQHSWHRLALLDNVTNVNNILNDAYLSFMAQNTGEVVLPIDGNPIIQGAADHQGKTVENSKRIRTSRYISVTKGERLTYKTGIKTGTAYIIYFDIDGTYVSESAWLGNNHQQVFDANYKIIIVFRNNNVDENISPSDYDATLTLTANWMYADKNKENILSYHGSIMPNLFDKNSQEIQFNKYINGSGWNTSANLGTYAVTHPIYVEKGVVYKYRHFPSKYGNTNGWGIFVEYPGNLSLIGGSNSTIVTEDGITYCEWTALRTGYACFNVDPNYIDSFMFCKKEEYPEHNVSFGTAKVFSDYPNSILAFDNYGKSEKAVIAFKSPNLFDKNSSQIYTSKYASKNGWSNAGGDERLGATHPILCEYGKTYQWTSKYKNTYGVNAPIAYRLDSSGEINNISNVATEINDFYEVTINSTGWYVFNINPLEKDAFMLCEKDNYPTFFAEYGKIYFNDQVGFDAVSLKEYPLEGKVLICDGDSIAAATPDDPKGLGGWFGRLQRNQHVIGRNYSVGGGSITYLSDSRHCISRSIDTIHNTYATLDYLILDGGTNDADLIGRFNGDTPPENFGTWSETDFNGSYDDTTFCGAVESMFYKAVNYWPNAHIGYIVAMEMGTNLGSLTNRKRYFDEAVKIAKKWHIPVLNLWENSGVDARLSVFYDPNMSIAENVAAGKFYRDGQHPSSYGYDKMQPMIESWVKGL